MHLFTGSLKELVTSDSSPQPNQQVHDPCSRCLIIHNHLTEVSQSG